MPIPLRKTGSSAMQMRCARVARVMGGTCLVADGRGMLRATRGPGCLLEPRQGDLVLVAENALATACVITVLEREGDGPHALSVAGDLHVESIQGHLALSGDRGLDLAAARIGVQAPRASVHARDLEATARRCAVTARSLRLRCQEMETRGSRVIRRIGRLHRRIADEDSRLGRLLLRVRGLWSLRARNALLDAKKRMRLDARRIDLG